MEHVHEPETISRAKPWIAGIALCLGCLPNVGCAGFSPSHRQPLSPSALFTIAGNIGPIANGSGTSVTLTGTERAVSTVDSAGNYTFNGLSNGVYTITPSKAGASFNPPNQATTIRGTNITGVNFRVSQSSGTVSISGTISPASTGSGATVVLSGAASATVTTDSSGHYKFSGLSNGAYSVTPSKEGAAFNPPNRDVTATSSDVTGVNFNASQSAATVSISGTISPAPAASGTKVTLVGAKASATTTADSLGNYSFSDLSRGSYTLTPSKKGLKFAPSARRVDAGASNISEINFSAGSARQNSGPIVINGRNGTIIERLKITSNGGDCVTIIGSTNITIRNSDIGPCAGNGIRIYGGSGINIFDSYIHPETQSPGCCDHNDGIFATASPRKLSIQGNVIAYGETNIEVQGGKTVHVVGNLLLNPRGANPRGQNFQCWNHCSKVTVENNYVLSTMDLTQFLYTEATQDSISFGISDSFIVQDNFITGGHSVYGCGIMLDTHTNGGSVLQNRLLDTGQCGIGITDGSHTASNNRVYNRIPIIGGGNTAIYVAHYGQSASCGPVFVTDNVADELQPGGGHSGWWSAGNCGTISIVTDVFGAAGHSHLTPVSTIFDPPLIPPQPKNCVVFSPYSTQTSAPACVP